MCDIESQVGHGFLDQGLGLEYLQLVVKKTGKVDGRQLHDIRGGCDGFSAIAILLLDKNLCTGAIDGGAVAQVCKGAAQTEDYAGYEPRPVG